MENDISKQVETLYKKMTLKEKVDLLYGNGSWHTHGLDRLGVPAITLHDGPCGIRGVSESAKTLLDGAPAATSFPAPCLTACSWDPEVTKAIGTAEGREALEQKTDVILAPGVNIKRNPLCGRNFEYLSEDPLLAGKMASGFIRGMQSVGVGVSLKHFALNSQETARLCYSADVDERAANEIYLKPFEIAVKEAKPWTVMCSYNQINGVYSCDNDALLNTLLRDTWGFDGVVVSDWGATTDPIRSHNHGMDLEMPCNEKRTHMLEKAYHSGALNSKAMGTSVKRMIALLLKAKNREEPSKAYNYGMGHNVAYNAAIKSMVLLKNERNALPLSDYKSCCIIGALANTPRFQGAGSSQVNPKNLVSFLEVANSLSATNKEVKYAPGYSLKKNSPDSSKLLLEAVDLASTSKKVVLFLGMPSSYESEGFDRHDMTLPKEQISLFNAIYSINKNIIVVLSCGAPVELPFAKLAKAILLAYLPGEAGGKAISDILLGKACPSGKLAESWPLHYSDVASHLYYPGDSHHALYKESVYVGYRYYLSAQVPVLYPFGYGLSYAKFAYSSLKVTAPKNALAPGKSIKVSLKVKNTSKVDGEEVVELYSAPIGGKVFKPVRELRAFSKVSLKAGATKEVNFVLPYDSLAHFSPTDERFEVEGGTYKIEVGSSAEDILLSSVIKVISTDETIDKKALLPSYYNLAHHGALNPSTEEFECLLSHKIETPRKKHFDFNSTVSDLAPTLAGKIILKYSSKAPIELGDDPDAAEDQKQMMMDTPVRMFPMAGIKERYCCALLALANKRPFLMLFLLLFGKRR